MNMPEELQKQLSGKPPDPNRPYNAHDLVLCYVCRNNGATANDLLVYLWAVTGKVTTRGYLYHILSRLRRRGHIVTKDMSAPMKANHWPTSRGAKASRPFKGVSSE